MAEELIGYGLVLESTEHGPQLCLGAIAASYPPQGGGPPITNWDWSQVEGYESSGGTTWGDYTVIGTFDGSTFTMTRPARSLDRWADRADRPDEERDRFSSPCPEPVGGWRVLDPALTTDASLDAAIEAAESLPGFARLWLDQSINPAAEDDEFAWNDPTKLILNVAVTGDVAGAQAALRQLWGGALCVSSAGHSESYLRRIRREVEETLDRRDGVDWLVSGIEQDEVQIDVVHDDGSLQREFEERYPGGLVRITSALQPYRSDTR